MRKLYTIALPSLGRREQDWVDRLRRRHDPDGAARIGAHFTLAFGCASVPDALYLAHVGTVLREARPFVFACRRVVVGTDLAGPQGYVFLVPDEGNRDIRTLHERLCVGPLAEHPPVGIPYVPHLTLGRTPSVADAAELCRRINARGVSVSGVVGSVAVVAESGDRVERIATFSLTDAK